MSAAWGGTHAVSRDAHCVAFTREQSIASIRNEDIGSVMKCLGQSRPGAAVATLKISVEMQAYRAGCGEVFLPPARSLTKPNVDAWVTRTWIEIADRHELAVRL